MAAPERYPHVFTPLRIGSVTVPNRVLLPAHTLNFGEDFLPSDRHLAYLAERARGGVGLIVSEGIRVHPTGVGRVYGLAGYDPRGTPAFRRLVEAVHAEGVPMFAQLLHVGRHVEGYLHRTAIWAPSPIPWSPTGPVPHAMTVDEIDEITAAHVRTARLLREAGFDGLEVHLGHGHLLQTFLSPASNRRTDEYGGSEANRLRFPLAVVRAVRDAMGPDYPVGIRISAEEFLPEGLGLADMQRIVAAIAAAVPLAFVNVSHSAYHASLSLATQFADMHFPLAPYRHLAAGIKSAVPALPVFAVCRFNALRLVEEVLAAGEADMVGMVRALIADPHLVAKARAGADDDIRPCIYSNQGCIGMIELDRPITCLMNPAVGREGEWDAEVRSPAAVTKRVLVVGGGPAGLEAARVAALRGHRVTLWERAPEVGGQVNTAARVTGRAWFGQVRAYLERQCRTAGVTLACGVEATAEAVRAFGADAVVLATGAVLRRPDFPGADRVLTVGEALEAPGRLGDRVVVIEADGNWPAVATAEHLADLGKRVTLVTSQGAVGWRITTFSLVAARHRLREKRVRILGLRAVREYEGARLVLEDLSTGDAEALDGVTGVVAACGGVARDDLYAPLRGAVPELRLVGDAVAPRTALEAIYDGHHAARAL
jgi:2,4-dienoyl-CoA reductase-like NADH-dependent reductase (Old Yellow Enzyme family)/thioredoxin reductase